VGIAVVVVLAVAAASSTFQCSEGSPPVVTAPSDFKTPASFTALAHAVTSAVVNVSASKIVKGGGPMAGRFLGPFGEGGDQDPFKEFFEKFFGDVPQHEMRQRSLGSGFVIDEQGFILTNNHVVEKAEAIEVKLANGETYQAKVVGKDPKTDIALIKIKPERPLPVLQLGDSSKAEVGEWVLAVGNPFGLGGTVTQGIVSATGRVIGAGPYDNFIQTDASINPGNSGGPLIDMSGRVIGVNTAIVAGGQGIGFAIPIDMAKEVLPQLKSKGFVTRGWLGVAVQEVTPDLAKSFGLPSAKGALVADVTPGGPSEKAGIKSGDVIVEFDGKKIDEMSELPRIVAATPVGKQVKVKVVRNGKEQTVNATVGELKEKTAPVGEPETSGDLGMKVRALTPDLARRLDMPPDETGLVATDVDSGGLAAEAGMQPGDIIKQINRKPVASVADYQKVISKAKPGETILFLVRRGDMTSFRAITIPGR
jgi:serine protease Do